MLHCHTISHLIVFPCVCIYLSLSVENLSCIYSPSSNLQSPPTYIALLCIPVPPWNVGYPLFLVKYKVCLLSLMGHGLSQQRLSHQCMWPELPSSARSSYHVVLGFLLSLSLARWSFELPTLPLLVVSWPLPPRQAFSPLLRLTHVLGALHNCPELTMTLHESAAAPSFAMTHTVTFHKFYRLPCRHVWESFCYFAKVTLLANRRNAHKPIKCNEMINGRSFEVLITILREMFPQFVLKKAHKSWNTICNYSHPLANETLNQKMMDILTTTESIVFKVFFLYTLVSVLSTAQISREVGDVVGAWYHIQSRGHLEAENQSMKHIRKP